MARGPSKNFLRLMVFFFLTMNHCVLYSIVRLEYRPICNPQWGTRFEEAFNGGIDVRKTWRLNRKE
jgi:hypothetical protein